MFDFNRVTLETLRLTFTTNGKLQIFQGNFHTFSTAKLLIHTSILMYNTVQIVLSSNSQLLTLNTIWSLPFAVHVNLNVSICLRTWEYFESESLAVPPFFGVSCEDEIQQITKLCYDSDACGHHKATVACRKSSQAQFLLRWYFPTINELMSCAFV